MIARVAVLAAVCALLVVAGCGSEPSSSSDAQRLDFTARTLDGEKLRGDSLLGKPTVLWFWAPWCVKCNREAPGVARVWQSNSDNVRFVGVAALDEVPAMQDFVRRHKLDGFEHLNDKDAQVWQKFGVTEQPAYAFISARGDIEIATGELSEDELGKRVAGVIAD
ncbi:MAG: redoxin domain-containing protein [Mycobacteriales bacterium]